MGKARRTSIRFSGDLLAGWGAPSASASASGKLRDQAPRSLLSKRECKNLGNASDHPLSVKGGSARRFQKKGPRNESWASKNSRRCPTARSSAKVPSGLEGLTAGFRHERACFLPKAPRYESRCLLKICVDVENEIDRSGALAAEHDDLARSTDREDHVVGPRLTRPIVDVRGERRGQPDGESDTDAPIVRPIHGRGS